MYSYAHRIRAVELYIKLCQRVRPTIRQLGYPTKNALKGWYREYQQHLDLPVRYAGREPKFSHEQKRQLSSTTLPTVESFMVDAPPVQAVDQRRHFGRLMPLWVGAFIPLLTNHRLFLTLTNGEDLNALLEELDAHLLRSLSTIKTALRDTARP